VKRTVNESHQVLQRQVPVHISTPCNVENVVQTSFVRSSRRQPSYAVGESVTSCDPIQTTFKQSLKVSKKVRNKSLFQVRSSRTCKSKWTSSRKVISQAQDPVVINELEKSPRRMPPNMVQPVLHSRLRSTLLSNNRLADENSDAAVRTPSVNVSECFRISQLNATLGTENNQLGDICKSCNTCDISQRLSSTSEMDQVLVNKSHQLSDASHNDVQHTVQVDAQVAADVISTAVKQQSSTDCNVDRYTSTNRHHHTVGRSQKTDAESHYVDMAVYKNGIQQPALLPEKDVDRKSVV